MVNDNIPSCNNELSTKLGKYCFEVTTTQLCNMRCTYCFENIGGHLDDQRNLNDYIPNIISKAKLMLEHPKFQEKYNGVHFAFWGGESSMNMKMIQAIVNEFHDDERCTFFMYSNGYEVDHLLKYINSIKEKTPNIVDRYDIQFSYDGKLPHDLTRFDINGNKTSDKIIENLHKFHRNGFKVTLKSTIKYDHFKHMVGAWREFDSLSREFIEKYNFNGIRYAPTIDEDHNENENYFTEFKEAVIEITKLELQRSKDGLGTLMGWFGGTKGQCSVGSSMGCLSVDGNYYVCHAGNYATPETKKDFTITNIRESNDKFLDDILSMSNKIMDIKKSFTEADGCQTCSATNCPRCEAINYEKSNEEDFASKWTEYNVDYMGFCRYWKFFGLVDRALQQKIK